MITFFVPGLCKTAGSKKAFFRPGMKFPVVVDDCAKGKDWKADVKAFAALAYQGEPLTGPLKVTMAFTLPRIRSHLRSNGAVKLNAPHWHTKKPDALKMARAVEDACTGILWVDDSQIAVEELAKAYGSRPGVCVTISRLEDRL